MKRIGDNEIYLLIKYIKSALWSVANPLSYIQDARYLKVNQNWRSLSQGQNGRGVYVKSQPSSARVMKERGRSSAPHTCS